MVRKAKVYGKQRTNELVSAIQNLNLNTSPKGIDFSLQSNSILPATHILPGPYIDIKEFPALAPVTGNKSRAVCIQKNELKDEPTKVENIPKRKTLHPFMDHWKRLNILPVDEITGPCGLRTTARSAGRPKEPNPESKLTHQPKVPRAFVSTAKGM